MKPKTNEEIIKEFREKFPKQKAPTKELEDWLWAEKKDIERFWLSKLDQQKQTLIDKVEKYIKEKKGNYPFPTKEEEVAQDILTLIKE